jgi:SAM-dependent methyltransferase
VPPPQGNQNVQTALKTNRYPVIRPIRALAAARAYHVVQVRPPGYPHAEVLTELAECVFYGLRRLGLQAYYRDQPPEGPARQIVLGAHLLDPASLAALPADAILYNSEQVEAGSEWLKGPYFEALKTREVWDYSAENVRRLTGLGARSVRHVPVGYVPELGRIAPPPTEDIDVLFYGSVNPRRQKILNDLAARGLNVVTLFGTYGEQRDQAIARAKVVLSVHFYESKIFEVVRAAYLLTNAKAVVAECGPDTSIEPDLRDAICGVPYDGLVDACEALVRNPQKRQDLAERGRKVFAARREEQILADSLEAAELASAGPRSSPMPALPGTFHLGSGRDFKPEWFNTDVNVAWGPDAVLDIQSPTLIGSTVETARFGLVTIEEESFDHAYASHVLEHIPDLGTAMTNLLRLLRPGGILEIAVPYDLSHGAWQDPTHVRAFNERSWLYYTEWHWYMGWTEARFDIMSHHLEYSALGSQLRAAGKSDEEIFRTPRAIDVLHVRLRKRYLQETERREALRQQPGARR